jgi:hypothetical protein
VFLLADLQDRHAGRLLLDDEALSGPVIGRDVDAGGVALDLLFDAVDAGWLVIEGQRAIAPPG